MNGLKLALTLIPIASIVIGCSSNSNTSSTSNPPSSEVNEKLGDLANSLSAQTWLQNVKREEAIQYWLVNGPQLINIDDNRPQDSFVRYVCAGRDTISTQSAAISAIKSAVAGLDQYTSHGTDSLAGQIARYKALSAPVSIPNNLDGASPDQSSFNCKGLVREQLDVMLTGISLEQAPKASEPSQTPEIALSAVGVAIEALKEVVAAVGELAKDTLAFTNDQLARKRAAEYIRTIGPHLDGLLNGPLSPKQLNENWSRRQASLLRQPYATFVDMLDRRAYGGSAAQIHAVAAQINQQLQPYDEMQTISPPGNVAIALKNALAALESALGNQKISLASVMQALETIISDLKDIQSKYAAFDAKLSAANGGSTK